MEQGNITSRPEDLTVWDFQFDLQMPFIEKVMEPRGCRLNLDELRAGFVSHLKVEDYGQRLRVHVWIGVGAERGTYGWRDYPRPRGTSTAELWSLRGSIPPGSNRLTSPYRWSLALRRWNHVLPTSPLAVELLFLHSQADDLGEESVLDASVIFTAPLDGRLLDNLEGTGQDRDTKMVERLRGLGEGSTWFGSAGTPAEWSWSLQRQW